jgi:hypothetical protein
MAQSPAPSPTLFAELSAHIDALIRTDKQLLAEEIRLEQAHAIAEPPQPGETVATRTQHYLNGFAPPMLAGLKPGNRLH